MSGMVCSFGLHDAVCFICNFFSKPRIIFLPLHNDAPLCVGLSNKIPVNYVDVVTWHNVETFKEYKYYCKPLYTVLHNTYFWIFTVVFCAFIVLFLPQFLSHTHFSLLLTCQSVSLNIFLFSRLSSLSPPFSCPVSGCCCPITQTLKLKTSTGETVYNHHCLNIHGVVHCISLYLVFCLSRDGGCASWSEVTTFFSHFATD